MFSKDATLPTPKRTHEGNETPWGEMRGKRKVEMRTRERKRERKKKRVGEKRGR